MQKNLFIGFLALLVCVLAGLALHQRRQLATASRAAPVLDVPSRTAPAREPRAPAPVRPRPVVELPVAQRPAAMPAPDPALLPAENAVQKPPAMAAAMEEFASMMSQPEVRDMMRSQQKLALDLTYGEFFRNAGLEGDVLMELKDLLVDKTMAGMEAGMSMWNSASTEEDRMAAAQQIKTATTEVTERIRELLGEDEYALFEQFEDTMPERMQVDLFRQSLREEEQPEWQQQHELVLAMHEERTAFEFSDARGMEEVMSSGGPDDESMQLYMVEMAELHERYLDRAAGILTPAQLRQFQATLDQSLQMQKASMEMATRMFGPGGGESP